MTIIHQEARLINVGERIRCIRKSSEMTQAELAVALDMDQSEISRIERGERKLSVHCLMQIAAVLSVPAQKLLEA